MLISSLGTVNDDPLTSAKFSLTVSAVTSLSCWCTMPMPRAAAARGESILTSDPFHWMVPRSGLVMPSRTFINVVFPAPFSPSSAWISLDSTDRDAPLNATVAS